MSILDTKHVGDFSSESIFIQNNLPSTKIQTVREFYAHRLICFKLLKSRELALSVNDLIFYFQNMCLLDLIAHDLIVNIHKHQSSTAINKMCEDDVVGILTYILCNIKNKSILGKYICYLDASFPTLFVKIFINAACNYPSFDVFNFAVMENLIDPARHKILDKIIDGFIFGTQLTANSYSQSQIVTLLIQNKFIVEDKRNLELWYIPNTSVTSSLGYIPSKNVRYSLGTLFEGFSSSDDIYKALFSKFGGNCELVFLIYLIEESAFLWNENVACNIKTLMDMCVINDKCSLRLSLSDVAKIFYPVLSRSPLRNFGFKPDDTEALICFSLLSERSVLLDERVNVVSNDICKLIGKEKFIDLFYRAEELLRNTSVIHSYEQYLKENFSIAYYDGLFPLIHQLYQKGIKPLEL